MYFLVKANREKTCIQGGRAPHANCGVDTNGQVVAYIMYPADEASYKNTGWVSQGTTL